MQGQEGNPNQVIQELTPPQGDLKGRHDEDILDDELSNAGSLTRSLEHRPSADRAQVKASLEGIRGIQKALTSLDPSSAAAAVNSQ